MAVSSKRSRVSVADLKLGRLLVAGPLAILMFFATQTWPLNQTIFADLDRSVRDMALNLWSDTTGGHAPGVVYIDFDDQAWRASGHAARTPVSAINDVLSLVENSRTAGVIIDIDLFWAADDPNIASLLSVVADWGERADQASLTFVRQVFDGDIAGKMILPDTPFDEVVSQAPNVSWGGGVFFEDGDGHTRTFLPAMCVGTQAGAALNLPAAIAPFATSVRPPLRDAWTNACEAEARPRLIHYQFDAEQRTRALRIDGTPALEVFGYCTLFADRCDSSQSSSRIDHGYFDGKLLVFGVSHSASGDIRRTPLGLMPGAMVVANTARSVARYGLSQTLVLPLKLVVVLTGVVVAHLGFMAIRGIRMLLNKPGWVARPARLLFNSMTAKWLAFLASWFFAVLLAGWAFEWTDWPGFMAAQYAAAFYFAIDEIRAMWASTKEEIE